MIPTQLLFPKANNLLSLSEAEVTKSVVLIWQSEYFEILNTDKLNFAQYHLLNLVLD